MTNRTNRRRFIQTGAVGALSTLASVPSHANETTDADGRFSEPARSIPIAEETDVIVCGAGPAGVAAAITAARSGAKTRLIELHGCLGGVWTAGALSWVIESDKPGVMQEIINELDRRGARGTIDGNNFAYDVEIMKLLLEEMCAAAGVEILMQARVTAAYPNASNRLEAIVTESKSGRQAWKAKAFVDATGDGDLSAQAGCGFDYGRERTGETQPMSLIALATGVRIDEIKEFVVHLKNAQGSPKDRLREEMERAGLSPSYSRPTLFRIRDDLFALMANHEYGVSALDAQQITGATMRARKEIDALASALRSLGAPWSDFRIIATGEQIGVREGRRIHGRYTVTKEDLIEGKRHDDAVCRVSFPVDVHATDPAKGKGYSSHGIKSKPYDIPYRALIARDVDGLLVAGRCISGDFLAHASYRVTGNAVAMGQAAGAATSLSVQQKKLPHNLSWSDVRQSIERMSR